MPRLQLDLPSTFTFSTDIPVRVGDINRGNHLSHVALISMIEEAREQFFTSKLPDVHYIMADIAIVYKAQARYGQTLRIEITAGGFGHASFQVFYRVTDAANGKEVATARSTQAFFDYTAQKSIPLTKELTDKLSA